MARKPVKITEDQTMLIQKKKEEIESLTTQLKNAKKELKVLEKNQSRYEEYMIIKAQEDKKREIVELISNSGLSLEEIKEKLEK